MLMKVVVVLVVLVVWGITNIPSLFSGYCFAMGLNHAGSAGLVFSFGVFLTVGYLQYRRDVAKETKKSKQNVEEN